MYLLGGGGQGVVYLPCAYYVLIRWRRSSRGGGGQGGASGPQRAYRQRARHLDRPDARPAGRP
eukprot:scaffold104363_cov27-Phaeocystis_antarctica.AAC.1